MGKNKITKIQNLDKLTNLVCLSLQNNRVTKIENLEALVNLTELYLSENGIEKLENLEANTKVETFDIAKNRIKTIENINHMSEMEEFWVIYFTLKKFYFANFLFFSTQANDNEVADWHCIDQLKSNKKIETVYLERNPLAKDVQYRKKLMLSIPWLKKIDATLCTS